MADFLDFLGFLNQQLNTRQLPRLESFLMPANFSSMVGEFMSATIPRYCKTLAKNTYHNGQPDLVPAGKFTKNACQHGMEGIEIKASRHGSGWQGHNAEDAWLMVFVFDANSARRKLGNRAQAVQIPEGGRSPIGKARLGLFWSVSDESSDDYRKCNTHGLR
jgi:hypothetical protein